MRSFRENVLSIDDEIAKTFFPERFGNEIFHSQINGFSSYEYRSTFAIKYVVSGSEEYYLDNERVLVSSDRYLLVNDGQLLRTSEHCYGEGMCIFLTNEIILDVLNNQINSSEDLLDNPFRTNDISSINFFENVYLTSDDLGQALKALHGQTSKTLNMQIDMASYYQLALALLKSQTNVRNEIESISRLKRNTREELYKRITKAKDYISQNALNQFNIDELAKHALLSKFQLIRTYKEVFGITPYDDYLKTKIKYSKSQLQHGTLSITEIASQCAFNDIHSFSKSFKKSEGMSPSMYQMMHN